MNIFQVKFVIKNLPLQNIMNEPPKLSLPGKLIFPSWRKTGHFSILGLGDIVMPGLLLCFVLRYDAYKRLQCAELGLPPPPMLTALQRMTYFHCSLIGYFLGTDLIYLSTLTLVPLPFPSYFFDQRDEALTISGLECSSFLQFSHLQV